nr:unnamed protein product [Callosobruchus chinensis]
MVRYCYVCKIYSHQRESQGLSFHRLLNEPSRRAIWIFLLGFEKTHPFPKYVEICSKHFHESDFVYLADGIRHLRVNAAPIPVHTAFDFAGSIRSDSSISIDSDGSPDKHATVSSSESQSEVDILAIVSNEVDPDKKRLKFDEDFILPGLQVRCHQFLLLLMIKIHQVQLLHQRQMINHTVLIKLPLQNLIFKLLQV